MKRLITIQSTPRICEIVTQALTAYAELAYPGEVSPCALPAKLAILDAAKMFAGSFSKEGHGIINSRHRVLLKDSIKVYYQLLAQQHAQQTDVQCQLLLNLCAGKLDTIENLDKQLDQAIEQDRGNSQR